MTTRRWRAAAAVLAAALALIGAPAAAQDALLRGTASYQEKIELPHGATFEARLEDVSRADAPATVLTSVTKPMSGNSITFDLPYLPDRIEAGHRYRIGARILVIGEPWFVTDTVVPVFDDGKPAGGIRNVEVKLVRVPLPPIDKADAPAGFALTGSYWKLVMLNGVTIPKANDAPEMHIQLNPPDPQGEAKLTGFAGCNQLMGSYKVQGAALTVAPGVALTRMACAPGRTAIEGGFVQALHDTARWRAFRGALDLLDAQGTPIARFVPRQLQ